MNVLSNKINGEYDRFVARQLFERSDMNKDNRISINEFVNTWLEAEHILNAKIQREKARLPAFEAAIKEIHHKNSELHGKPLENQKRFVFRIIDIKGFSSNDPVFDIRSNDYQSATVRFTEFERGDVVIDMDEIDVNVSLKVNASGGGYGDHGPEGE